MLLQALLSALGAEPRGSWKAFLGVGAGGGGGAGDVGRMEGVSPGTVWSPPNSEEPRVPLSQAYTTRGHSEEEKSRSNAFF